MKKQQQRGSRTRKTSRVADLAPKSKRGSAVKAGAFDAFATQLGTTPVVREDHTKWIEIGSVQFK